MHDKASITSITERGQVSIPAHLRRELSLTRGRQLLWEKTGDREMKLVVLDDAEPPGARAMLGFARRFRETRTTESWMAELRNEER